ncbi:MAG: hypothetical protein KID00_02335 [Clostridium argentinense]|uniref:DUF1540 domain-containing protein n=1 Tax=Clostridium faecium TaxID=2762223 RepID=A0ABR8YSF2_9CLOT|nr:MULTISPECIES: hypothetical protein [Clostridium]MBD8047185.1 hypothetical protein [Clostridium faecium]MBS5822695.1 hypothetical protein [Clostridium argentinense]MDU1348434.1 hypothetical protein [Clostridium argentinense]
MASFVNEINFDRLITNLGNCCLKKDNCCTNCVKETCLIGYSEESVKKCLKNNFLYVENGYANIPLADIKVYDHDNLITAIADILKQCKNCRENHYNDCIINIIRSCYEVALIGEMQKYKGSALVYLSDIKNINEDIGNKIFEKYSSIK